MFTKDFYKKGLSFSWEIIFSLFATSITLVGSFFLTLKFYQIFSIALAEKEYIYLLKQSFQAFFLTFLIYGNLVYLLTRYGYFLRLKNYLPTSEKKLFRFYLENTPSITILIPSYKEEIEVIRRSLLSSCLQDYPAKNVVLLIDDPANPGNNEDRLQLERARSLVDEIQEIVDVPGQKLEDEFKRYQERQLQGVLKIEEERQNLYNLHLFVVDWFNEQGKDYAVENHEDKTFVYLTFKKRIALQKKRAKSILKKKIDFEDIEKEYRYLASIFRVEITSFLRKRYVNLSHALNKAMNLNSYLGLMGKSYTEELTNDGLMLKEARKLSGDLIFPETKYVAMLDADSVLTYDYVLRLIFEMEKSGNERLAVIQTPYSAFPNPKKTLERIAGATTDMQYLTHQGFTHFNATFWVGANAIVRKKALDDIATEDLERNYPIIRYVHDRTVIEDTESSIDLVDRGWTLCNYPQRLSYSQTPCDFGALLIQRRRWANGGLIILPKLIRYLFRMPWSFKKLKEFWFRFNYLFSIAATVFGFILSTCFSVSREGLFMYSLMAIVPYTTLYSRDMKMLGYRFYDFFLVLALNILLIPVNLAGVLKSMQQAVTGRQIPFARTPKVDDRTSTPALFVLFEFGLVAFFVCGALVRLFHFSWITAFYDLLLSFSLISGVLLFMGFKESFYDLTLSFKGFRNSEN